MIGQRRFTPWLYVAPALIVFTGTVVVPIFWSLSLGFFQWNGLGPLVFTGVTNFVQMFQDQVLRQAFTNNLAFALLGTAAQFTAGLLMAILLLSIAAFRNLIRVAYFIPCVISSVAVSQIFSQLFSADPVGVVDAILGNFVHGTPPALLASPHLALVIVTLVDAYKFCAIYMVIYYAALIAVDQEVLDAASLDGCNWWQQYVYVKFPLIKSVIAVTIVMLVSGTLKGFDVSYILTGGGPGASTELVSTYLYKTIFQSSDFGYGSAISIGLVIECLVIVVILRRLLQRDPEA